MSRIKNLRDEALAMHKEYQGKIEAVSYTHLDVYKRQGRLHQRIADL